MRRSLASALIALAALPAVAQDYKRDIGYDSLAAIDGQKLPTGAGVSVIQVEGVQVTKANPAKNVAASRGYSPDPKHRELQGKAFRGAFASAASAHATGVGRLFYGSKSVAPGVRDVTVMSTGNFLRHLMNARPGNESWSRLEAGRVVNHSWVGGAWNEQDVAVLRRLDWAAMALDALHVYGVRNRGNNSPFLVAAFNGIAVGRSDGRHATSLSKLAEYGDERVRPEIVAPQKWTSSAAPVVAAAGALLVETLTRDAPRRDGVAPLVKALLLAGADRSLPGYGDAAPSANGLDRVLGAGELDIGNSYRIAVGRETDSAQDGAGAAGPSGFDYDPAFGGLDNSNVVAHYTFTADANQFSASLAWHANAQSGAPGARSQLYDLDLALLDVTGERRVVAQSFGRSDTTENIWTELTPGRQYCLEVTVAAEQAEFRWSYALAWHSR